MQFVKLLSVFLCVLSVCSLAAAQTCTNGISCYPSDCCGQYRQCVGTTFYPVQQTAPGTVCKAGKLVFASECTTPCSNSATTPSTPSTPTTPTTAPTVKATQAPPTQATSKPIATQAPATQAPATQAPTQRPATQAPATQAPATQAPTQRPATQAPATQAPATQAPATQKPTVKATIAPTNAPTNPPSNGACKLSDVFTEADFNALFPHANGAYLAGLPNQHAIFNYSYLVAAAQRFPTFACQGDVATRKREVAAFLAHTSQETSGWWAGQLYNWGFYFSTEVGCTNPTCTMYCQYDPAYPCAAGKGYYGRGPIQLSWNYNYGQVSKYLYGNDVLLQNPDMMFDERGTAFTTAIWFWMTPQGPKPSCHDVMAGVWTPSAADIAAGRLPGFGMTTNIINGGLECNTGVTIPKVVNRIGYYSTYAARFGVSIGNNVECNVMRSF